MSFSFTSAKQLWSDRSPWMVLLLGWIAYRTEHRFFSAYNPGWQSGLQAFLVVAFLALLIPRPAMRRLSVFAVRLAILLCGIIFIAAVILYPQPFLIGVFLTFSFYVLGRYSLDIFCPQEFTFLESTIFSVAAGAILFSYLELGFGLFGILGRRFVLSTGGILWGLGLLRIQRSWTCFKNSRSTVKKCANDFLHWCESPLNAGIVIILCCFPPLMLLGNLTPPISTDDMTYHLGAARIFLRLGRIAWLPDFTHFNSPFSEEMLYVAALSLGNVFTAPAAVNLFFIALLIGSFWMAGRRFFTPQVGFLSLFFLFSIPNYIGHTFCGSTDLKYLTYCILALYGFGAYCQTQNRRWQILSAVFVGFSLSFRYHGIILAAILGLAILLERGVSEKQKLVSLATFAAVVLLCGFPWYARNWINTGNPIFPTSTTFFHGFYGDPELSEVWRQLGDPSSPFMFGQFGYGTSFEAFYKLPWRLTFDGGYEGCNFTPAYLAFFLFVLWKLRHEATAKILLFSGLYLIVWFFQMQQMKFLLPSFGLLGFAIAYAVVDRLKKAVRPLRAAGYSLLLFPVICSLGAFYVDNSYGLGHEIPVFLKRETPDDYLSEDFPFHRTAQFMNTHLTSHDRVFSMLDTCWYYLDRPYLLGCPLHQLFVDYRTMDSCDNFLARLKELGITHVLIPKHINIFMSPVLGSTDVAFFRLLPKLRGPEFQPIYEDEAHWLMAIHYRKDLPAYDKTAQQSPYEIGQFLLDHGSLMMARMQFVKAQKLGDPRAAAAIDSIDRMTPLMRGDYYFTKSKEFSYPHYIKAALDEYNKAVKQEPKNSPNRSLLEDRIKQLHAYALQVIPWVWGRL